MWHDTTLYDLTWYDPKCTCAVSPALPRYEGNWVNDKKHGHGEEHYNDGGRFSGSHSLAMSSKISMTIAWHCIPLHFCFSGRLVLRLVLGYRFQMVSRIKAWTTNRSSFVSVLFRKVVGICLPWNSLTLTFMKVLFSLKCYTLGQILTGTWLSFLSVFIFQSMTRRAMRRLHWFWRGFHPHSSYPSLSIISDLFLACKPNCIPLNQPSR